MKNYLFALLAVLFLGVAVYVSAEPQKAGWRSSWYCVPEEEEVPSEELCNAHTVCEAGLHVTDSYHTTGSVMCYCDYDMGGN